MFLSAEVEQNVVCECERFGRTYVCTAEVAAGAEIVGRCLDAVTGKGPPIRLKSTAPATTAGPRDIVSLRRDKWRALYARRAF